MEFVEEETEQSIAERFEKIACLYPHYLAVKAGQRSLSYDELNRAANRIARAILAIRGNGSEPITLLFEHGLDAIVALFGVLKAGKSTVSLDRSFPLERMNSILEDSQSGVILTNNRNLQIARQLLGGSSILVLNMETLDGSCSAENLGIPASPDDIASITYTSGSTGKPKGVIKSNRYILYGMLIYHVYFATSPSDRLSLIHSLSFGSGQVNFFQALLSGAALNLFDVKSEGVRGLADWLRSEQITLFHSPPALFRQLAEMIDENGYPHLRLINLSGAPVTSMDVDLFRNRFGESTELGVMMGTTETHAIVIAQSVLRSPIQKTVY